MKLIRLFKTASVEANFLVALSSVLLLIKIFIFNRFQSGIFGVYEVGVIAEAVMASVIASYVFYLLVVHVKEQSDREILRPYIGTHTKRIVDDCISQLKDLSGKSTVTLDFLKITKEDILDAFSKIAPNSDAPLLISVQPNVYANWIQYFIYYADRSNRNIRKLLDQLPFLDAQHVKIVAEIDDCTHFSFVKIAPTIGVANENLESWAESFYKYCMLCRDLDSYLVHINYSSSQK